MKKMKDSCFNEFDPNAMSVEAALESILTVSYTHLTLPTR